MLLPILAGMRGGVNMYHYAGNNPVMNYDPNGQFAVISVVVAIVVGVGGAMIVGGGGTHILANTDWSGLVSGAQGMDNPTWNRMRGYFVAGRNVAGMAWGWASGIGSSGSGSGVVAGGGGMTWGSSSFGDNVFWRKGNAPYGRKRPAIRDRSNTRKEAREKARLRGKGKPPIGPERHNDGRPHFHPNVPNNHPFRHDHFYFPPGQFAFIPILLRRLS